MLKYNIDKLEQYKELGYIMCQKHPKFNIFIWNYTQKTQFEGFWDNITLSLRGTVLDINGNIIARSFPKFFNIEENKHTPTSEFDVYEKMDGSLIIIFWYDGGWVVASRGSFTSEQALAAQKIFFDELDNNFSIGITYLFEFTAPWNRIVVNYGEKPKLTLLGAVRTDTGEEATWEQLNRIGKGANCDVVKKYNGIDDFNVLKKMIPDDEEGFVVKFSNGDRCKIKGEEYLRLHKLMTNVSTTSVWENLMNGKSMDELLLDIPDEFFDVVKATEKELDDLYWKIADEALHLFKTFYVDGMSAKDFADRIRDVKVPYHSLLFCQFNLKFEGYSETIWKHIKPEFRKL